MAIEGITRASADELNEKTAGLVVGSPVDVSELIAASSKMSLKYDKLTKELDQGRQQMETESIRIREKFDELQIPKDMKRKGQEGETLAMKRAVREESDVRRYGP